MITEAGIIGINKRFDKGVVVNGASLHFALSSMHNTKDWLKQLAYLVRALLVDHVFEEGNKRTAAALTIAFYEDTKCAYDPYKVDKIIFEIASKNVTSVEHIRRKLKDALR